MFKLTSMSVMHSCRNSSRCYRSRQKDCTSHWRRSRDEIKVDADPVLQNNRSPIRVEDEYAEKVAVLVKCEG